MKTLEFSAPRWLRSTHLQTIWAPLARTRPVLARQRERLVLADGDFIDLDWLACANENSPLVIILHGLAGSTDSIYILGIQQALQRSHIASVAMHFRGAGGTHNRLARTYHAGETGDLQTLASTLAARFPQRKLAVLGYSLGGNITLKWLGETGVNAGVIAACGETPRPGQDGTWISPPMIEAYSHLHELGWAHSVETYVEGDLVGGLYGLAIGRMFYGESMFSRCTDASKVAFAHLIRYLVTHQFGLIDCQMRTEHLASLGGREISRETFLAHLGGYTVAFGSRRPWSIEHIDLNW